MNETVMTVVGNVITEVRSRLTSDGVRVASFRVASNERRFDKEAGQWADGDRLYLTVTCWRKLASNVLVSLGKGDPVMVTGRVYTRGFEVEGQKRSVTELEATAVGPDLSRCSAELVRVRRAGTEDVGPEQPEGSRPPCGPSGSAGVDLAAETAVAVEAADGAAAPSARRVGRDAAEVRVLAPVGGPG
jgi:single-strand DNA-binding protein